jgi:PAS domain S-box-containing protein
VAGVGEEQARAAEVQNALYRIAELASAAHDMQEFYAATHEVVGELMDARNFYITLYDEERQLVSWPYYVDELDDDPPDPDEWVDYGRGAGRGSAAYVLRTGMPQLHTAPIYEELIAQGEIEPDVGVYTKDSSWLGVPLKDKDRTIGVLVVQSYTKDVQYTEQDKDLLAFVGQHVGSALSRARAIEETRERNAELAVINTVQSALAGELEMQAIYDVVGDKIQEIFDAQAVLIMTLDKATGLMHFPYLTDRGGRQYEDPVPLTGFTRRVLESREPLMLNGAAAVAEAAEKVGSEKIGSSELPKSLLFVPLLTGDRAAGVISLQNMDREHAFDEADQRLLTTLAGDLSVALENARLVHETRQRNAELALINSVQSALAGELEMQAIYDVVGDKIGEIFDAQGVAISIVDQATGLQHFPYLIEHGERFRPEPGPVIGFSACVLGTCEPLLINEDLAAEAERFGSKLVAGEMPKSALFVPLVTSSGAIGIIALDNFDREHAFSDADQRLLTTLASSLSVALENARLVHETRERNAELALINSVQQAIAGELDQQAIYDAVGDQIREIFDAHGLYISTFDETTGLANFPYLVELGERRWPEPRPLAGFSKHVLETNAPLLVNENMPEEVERYGSSLLGEAIPKSILLVPLDAGGRGAGVIALVNMEREHAFDDADVRLLTTLAGSLSVALENARLVHETRQRNAELGLINGVQAALAGELDLQAIYDAVGDRIRDVFDAEIVDIAMYDETSGLLHFPYAIERGERSPDEPIELMGFRKHAIETCASLRIDENLAEQAEQYGNPVLSGEMPKSVLYVPLLIGGKATGVISLQSIARERAFSDSDQQLLETLAASLSVALENARLVHETRQRNAELALINSVQEALVGELELEAIYESVGDRLRDVFDAQVVDIAMYNEATRLMQLPYVIERGERLYTDPIEVMGFRKHVMQTLAPLMLADITPEILKEYGNPEVLNGDPSKSALFVPLVTGRKAIGVVSLQNVDRAHAFDEADQRLLTTLAGSLSVALENARLVHETRQRNAELALINGVQDALAGELEMQAIYDAVGERIRDVFDAQLVDIAVFDESDGLVHFPYGVENGRRVEDSPLPPVGFRKVLLEAQEPLLINEGMAAEGEKLGMETVGAAPKSGLFVPLVAGGAGRGWISLQNADREHAFSESDQQLLETLASSLGVALENARLVHETRQRNAELALINSVQEALAGELEMQAIYDVVGDKIQEIFDAQVVDIGIFDFAAGVTRYPYTIERGVRFPDEPTPIDDSPSNRRILETKAPILTNDVPAAERDRGEAFPVVQGEPALSTLFAPLISGDEVRGRISLQNLDRTNAFTENDVRLLTTLAGSLSVALENARLVHETRQRNAELALINSVQEAIAGELDSQAIYDAVGDRIQEIFDAQVVSIRTVDEATGLQHFPYIIERGVRLEAEPGAPAGFSKYVLETREPLLIVEDLDTESERYGSSVTVGEDTRSLLFVPLVTGGKATGLIGLENIDREHAFSESDRQLLETLAGSLSVALENARLVHETRQRNAELALINSVQSAIAGELDPQAIYDLVGDRIQEVFDAQVVVISIFDEATSMLASPYVIENGARLELDPMAIVGFRKHVMESREPLMINENVVEAAERYGNPLVLAGDLPKSDLFVPLIVGGRATGVISLQNVDREHAFTESDERLLVTLAGSLSVALENARLVHETRQRNAELALINGVQDAIAGELEPQAIYEAVGDRIRGVFDAHTMTIGTLDEATGLIHYPYIIERGERLYTEPVNPGGFAKHVLETRESLLIGENIAAEAERYGSSILAGEWPKSVLFVPLVVAGKATGVISLQNVDREHAFGESDQQLLTTLAGSLSVALENARLVDETRQRVSELATVNSVGHALASQLDLDALIELVGEQVRETFDADIAYVALHDEAAGRIEFAYYHETGERRPQDPLEYGEGLTSQILRSREPLLLNREEQYEGQSSVGTPSRSYLGVPILVGERSIGVISVQSIEEEGRFGEADARLLATLAANVGVAIQNARLFAEVERQREYSASLVEISPAAVIVMDRDEVVTEWNPAAAELFGYSPEEAVGRHVDDLVFGDASRDEGREITAEAMREGRAQRITTRSRKDGTPVDVELMLVPLVVEGAHSGFLGVYHDVTELQRARQEAEAATQAKSAFLATMSHEIRTPMNAVIGMTDLLLGTELTGEQREFAEVVHSSGDALLHVIDDILDYSKIEAGKLDLEHQPFNLRDCVEGALDIVAPRAWEKEIELGCLIDEGAPAGVVGDEARLRQVLLNLLSNAVKFTDAGEVAVLVDAEPTGAGTHRVDIAVRDTGIGIPTDRMDRLFTSFSQVDASTTRKFGGTGLGLAISKRLVELMGGTISVESEPQRGSTFRISLPVAEVDVPAKIALEDGLAQLAGKRVLVVDDNATNREIVTRHARSWGMEPVSVELPAEALALVEAGEPFDIAVLDMMMPVMDGLALAGAIREHRSAEELPLLLLTSLGHLPQAESGSVFSAQLAKPFKASQLYNTLLRLLTPGAEEEEVEPVADTKRARSALRILLAEDNAMNQKVALRLLEQLGYRADVANNGLEAIAALEQQPYDVVLMDVQMPELDGLDATRRICEQWPEETRPHIIAMTANALPEDREACFAAGMNDYVAKPIRGEELVAALKRAKPLRNGDGAVALDAGALGSLRDLGGDEFLREVIDAFLADAPDQIATLRRSLAEQSTEELRRAAHTLKSNGATLGALEFAELCRTLEQRAKDGELDGAPELVDRIEQEYGRLQEALTTLRSEPVS